MPGMRTISLALQEGFLNDRVVVSADGRQLAALDDLSTRVQIGLAQTLDLEVEEGEILTVHLPDKNLRAEVKVDASAPPFITASVRPDGKALELRQSDAPPGYL